MYLLEGQSITNLERISTALTLHPYASPQHVSQSVTLAERDICVYGAAVINVQGFANYGVNRKLADLQDLLSTLYVLVHITLDVVVIVVSS